MDIDLKWLPGCLLPAIAEQNHLVNQYLLQNICKGCQQSLGFVLNTVLATEAFHQGSHFPVVVPRHCGEQAAEWDEGELLQGLASSLCKTSPCPRLFPFFPPGWYSLVLDLEVQVPGEPVIEHRLVHVAGCVELGGKKKPKNPTGFRFYFPASPTIEPPAITAHPYLARKSRQSQVWQPSLPWGIQHSLD